MLRFLAVSGQICLEGARPQPPALRPDHARRRHRRGGGDRDGGARQRRPRLGRAHAARSAGTSIVEVSAGNFTRGGESMNIASGLGAATTLTRDDAAAISAPRQRRARGRRPALAHLRRRLARGAGFTLVHGTEPSLADIHGWTWLEGEGFTDADVAASAAKVVLGRIAARGCSATASIRRAARVTIDDREFEVVGMMRAVDADQDEAAFVPVTTLGALTSRTSWLQTITVGVTEAGVADLGGRRHHGAAARAPRHRTSARPRRGPRGRSAACRRPAAATAAWARPTTSR